MFKLKGKEINAIVGAQTILIWTYVILVSPCDSDNGLCMLGNYFPCFCCHLLIFFIISFFKKFFQEHYQSFNGLNTDQDLGPNCLQRLSADDKSRNWTALSVTSHINCTVASCLINVVYLMACAFIRS